MALDPTNNAIDRIRVKVGDIDMPYLLGDELYQYFINSNTTEYAATIQSLEAIVAKLAKAVHEKSDSEEIWGQELYDNYKRLLDDYKNNPSYFDGGFTPFAGGISKSDIEANKQNTDANRSSFEIGGFSNFNNSIWGD